MVGGGGGGLRGGLQKTLYTAHKCPMVCKWPLRITTVQTSFVGGTADKYVTLLRLNMDERMHVNIALDS